MFRAAGRHQRRRALMRRAVADFVQPLVQLGRGRKGDGEPDGAKKNRGGQRTQFP